MGARGGVGKGGRGGRGMKGGAKVVIEGHRHDGIFIARGKEDALVTKNMVPGESVYGEKRVSVEAGEVRMTDNTNAHHTCPVCRPSVAFMMDHCCYCWLVG